MSNYPARNIAEIKEFEYCKNCGRYNIDMSTHTCTAQVVNWQSVGFATHSEYVAAKVAHDRLSAFPNYLLSQQDRSFIGHMWNRIFLYECHKNISHF